MRPRDPFRIRAGARRRGVGGLLCATALALSLLVALPGGGLGPAAHAAPGASEDGGPAEAGGLRGEYFRMSAPGARDFAELGGESLEPRVQFSDLTSTFELLNGRQEHTTARWTGRIAAPRSGDYTFHMIGDNGFRLFIDDKPVIDHWEPDWDNEQHSEPVHLTKGKRHDVRVEMFQDEGGSHLSLSWSAPGVDKQVVPDSAFSPPRGYHPYPVDLTLAGDGRRFTARLEKAARGLKDLASHLRIEADTTAMPVRSVRRDPGDPRSVRVTLAKPVQKGQEVRFAYDGEGKLSAGDRQVPQLLRHARNDSRHRLRTTWGDKVDPNNPLPEYPRPQTKRQRWQNLNGQWQFAGAAKGDKPPFGRDLKERITVPYPVESQLSGLERHEDHMFYRKLITVPRSWRVGDGQRLKLNFGAVDHHARVWVNGKSVAEHRGGYTAFSADVTDALTGSGKQEIVVAVTDTTGDNQPKGKQTSDPGGIFYTASSGIWQTVWMEPVAPASVDRLDTTPDLEDGALTVRAVSQGASEGASVTAVARDKKGRQVGSVTGRANGDLRLPVPDAHLWTPDDPYLYDLEVTLTDGRSTDRVDSYFGMRSLSVRKVGGVPKLVLNGKPFFSLAMLDQGFWPDGLHTQPSDQALSFDLRAQKDLGFNAVRKHIKAESARWYYHADRLGLLVWQDFVSGTLTNEAGRKAFVDEGRELMRQLHSSPSVSAWIVFNEGWGEWDREETGRIAESVRKADPSRVVNAHSGVNCCDSKGDSGAGDIIDHHDYNNDDPPEADDHRAAMDGEHGGFTLRTPGHMWPGAPTRIYSGVDDKDALTRQYVDNTERHYLRQAGEGLSGSVYTQVSDLENELNGLWTYDRRVLKVHSDQVREINEKVIAAGAKAGSR
ncbi:PA14 domain-containing protein [Streptomyces sp. NPDC005438]|uniref:PA14 domain-containing protein n=1 Tax=Streptomyces sp. NPDC005438 TaxID=3156880 RepID=UPI0033BC1658